jgi:hypothetical protein
MPSLRYVRCRSRSSVWTCEDLKACRCV